MDQSKIKKNVKNPIKLENMCREKAPPVNDVPLKRGLVSTRVIGIVNGTGVSKIQHGFIERKRSAR